MTYYKMLPDREEALLKYRAAAYTLARRALNDLENRRALELLELLPQGYEDTDRMREKAMLALGIPVTEPPASEPEPTEEPAESPAPATETPAVSSGPEETPAASPSPTPSPSATPDPTPAPTPEAAENSPETAKPAASATPADTGEDSFLVRDDED